MLQCTTLNEEDYKRNISFIPNRQLFKSPTIFIILHLISLELLDSLNARNGIITFAQVPTVFHYTSTLAETDSHGHAIVDNKYYLH